ncbi:cAMP-regulated phosphoprotein 21 isoform X1 [Trichomycterus rosablanca]|uniref:cAMP-regulated phosphoprotein 21 isoform X1 n=1 Tax=Trichomycterus rosablanca TaxID=2290929 RepID=UPI002F35127B
MAFSDCEEEQKGKHECLTPKKTLSKERSVEYTDSTGIDLEKFLITTLKSSPRDRLMLLKLEQDMTNFMTDNCSYKKFPQMSSYHRMLVHRVAAFFGLEHNVDHSGKSIIINKTSNSRIPEQQFAEHVQEEKSEEMISILKRDSSQEKEDSQPRTPRLKDQIKSKSFEEREEEYHRVRERIFSQDVSGPVQSVYIETRGPEDCCNVHSEAQRKRQLFRGNRSSSSQLSSSRQSSLESNWSDPRPWSSTDSESSLWSSKPTLSHSDSNSKLYKPAVPVAAESSIPPGSILLNPLTGQPYRNPDGTPAVYNPPGSQQSMNSQINTMQHQAPLPTHQQPATSHCLPQYSSVTYAPPQQVIPVSPSQLNPLEQSGEDFLPQFGQMTLNHQSSGDPSDLSTYYLHGSAPTHNYMQPQHNYTPYFTADSYMNTGMALTPLSAPPAQTCTQHNTQASMYCYPAQCANTTQQYGPASYSTQTGYATLLSNQQQAYPGMVATQVLPPTQKSIMGSCPSTASYQMAPQMQSSYPSTVLVSRQAGQNQSAVPPAGVTVYCNPLSSSPSPLSVGVTCQSGSCRSNINQNQCWY